jgi:hypothetical protein
VEKMNKSSRASAGRKTSDCIRNENAILIFSLAAIFMSSFAQFALDALSKFILLHFQTLRVHHHNNLLFESFVSRVKL